MFKEHKQNKQVYDISKEQALQLEKFLLLIKEYIIDSRIVGRIKISRIGKISSLKIIKQQNYTISTEKQTDKGNRLIINYIQDQD